MCQPRGRDREAQASPPGPLLVVRASERVTETIPERDALGTPPGTAFRDGIARTHRLRSSAATGASDLGKKRGSQEGVTPDFYGHLQFGGGGW